MPSLLPGYKYDIFISYRQKDNKYDGWVTEFVENLTSEIKATFKKDISIYFDENPHDGLLETHDVDQSLNDKVKCLVFIPIVSQTYCDPDCFAWQKEFLAFRDFVIADEYGLDIKLIKGNAAKRILPVKIHEIDQTDQALFDKEIGGAMRSVDFIYKEAGVNRPLRANEEFPEENLNHTLYRNQVNKVANAIKELINGILDGESMEDATSSTTAEAIEPKSKTKNQIQLGSVALLLLLAVLYLLYNATNKDTIQVGSDHKSIAVLAFDDQSPNGDQQWLGDGVADEILNVLAQTEGLKVSGKTSSFSFKGTNTTTKEIGEILDVKTVLEGSVSKVGDKLRITAQLIDVETEAHIWSDKYDRDADDIFAIVDEVAQSIVGSLMSELSMDEVSNIKMLYQPNAEAYEYFMKGEHFHMNDFLSSARNDDFEQAKDMYIRALSIEPTYGEALAGLANLYDTHYNIVPEPNKDYVIHQRDSIINVAFRVNPNSPYVLTMKGYLNTNYDSAFYFLNKAYSYDPNHLTTKVLLSNKLWSIGLYNESNVFCNKILKNDPLNMIIQTWVIISLWATGQISELREQAKKLLEFDKNNYFANYYMFFIALLVDQNIEEAKRINNQLNNEVLKVWLLASEGRSEEILKEISITSPIYLTYAYAALGNEQFLYLLDSLNSSAINKYEFPFTYLDLKNNLIFEKIRQEPQFKQWLKEAKVVHEERVRKYGHLFDD